MVRHIFVILTLTCLLKHLYGISVNTELINNCNYASRKHIFICSQLSSSDHAIGSFLSNQTRYLILNESVSLVFQDGHHLQNENYKYLTSYSIKHSNHLDISGFSFLGLDDLYYLQIVENQWPVVKNHTFNGLYKLEVLNLQNNNISLLEDESLTGLISLTTLELTQNNLQSLTSYLFKDLTNLVKLFLEHNNIEVIEENAFFGLRNLDSLDLMQNNLQQVDAKEFNTMPKLQYLYLDFNNITEITGGLILPDLKFLHMQHNKISCLDENVFRDTPSLQIVDLSFNDIFDLSERHFLHLPTLGQLDIRKNNLDIELFKNLRNRTLVIHEF